MRRRQRGLGAGAAPNPPTPGPCGSGLNLMQVHLLAARSPGEGQCVQCARAFPLASRFAAEVSKATCAGVFTGIPNPTPRSLRGHPVACNAAMPQPPSEWDEEVLESQEASLGPLRALHQPCRPQGAAGRGGCRSGRSLARKISPGVPRAPPPHALAPPQLPGNRGGACTAPRAGPLTRPPARHPPLPGDAGRRRGGAAC